MRGYLRPMPAPLLLLLALPAHAVEGMWEPSQLPSLGPALTAAGWKGDPAALARLDAEPLGAVVSLDGWCTASFVSPEGLLITNHHCVKGFVGAVTEAGEKLVDNGFYAAKPSDERPVGGDVRVWVTDRVEDVTATVEAPMPKKLDDAGREALREQRKAALVAACERREPDHGCEVASFYGGERHLLVHRLELRDVRLVMAPPDMVGNYGDEEDNFRWPRHAGDFGFLRAYVGPDGRPADYSPQNVAYHPRFQLPLNPKGIAAGDFVMVAGYPYETGRWRSAAEMALDARYGLPAAADFGAWALPTLQRLSVEVPADAAVLEVLRSEVGNGATYAGGALWGFEHLGTLSALERRDAELRAWVRADATREARWGAALDELAAVARRREPWARRELAMEELLQSELLTLADTLYHLSLERQKPDPKREAGFQERDLDELRAWTTDLDDRLSLPWERALLERSLTNYLALPPDQRVPELDRWLGGAGPDAVAGAIDRLTRQPLLADEQARAGLLGAPPTAFTAATDGGLSLAVALRPYLEARAAEERADAGALARLRPLYIEARRAFSPGASYSDANNTLRVSFGTVQGYSPRDAVTYTPFTTLAGIAAKAGPWPFAAPPALLAAIAADKPSPYRAKPLGTVPVDFLADLDITGGNSGSPTLDRDGQLVGLVFDGNYEGIVADWAFDQAHTRSIHVDVRYILWYLDAVVGAEPLLGELGVTPSFPRH